MEIQSKPKQKPKPQQTQANSFLIEFRLNARIGSKNAHTNDESISFIQSQQENLLVGVI